MSDGVVVRAGRGFYDVQTDGGKTITCKLRGNLKKNLTYVNIGGRQRVDRARKLQETDALAVGDRVRISEDDAVVEEVYPRRAALTRRSGNERERQTLVANLELAVIVFAAAEPQPDLFKLDRFLVMAEDAELKILIVLNKSELASEEEVAAFVAEFSTIGYDVLAVSAKTNRGIDTLREKLTDRISALCGPSGVGKSSLLNAIQPGLALKTGETGGITHAGRHTTVRAELLPLHFGGWVADTPGLRQVEFWDLPAEDVMFCFPELVPLIGTCRFADCRHRTEPQCAVRAALADGRLSERRYQSYLQMTS
ncbi:MAG: ribosome small subunit-dependent GTPase A [Armatimonas sp.]